MGDFLVNNWRLLVVGFVLGQFFLYAAKSPAQQLIRSLAAALKAPFRLASGWCKAIAGALERRNRELCLEVARAEAEKKLERELIRIEAGVARELQTYPTLQRRLAESVRTLEEDLTRSSDSPPALPGWPEAMKAIAEMPQLADSHSRTILEAIKKAAGDSEEKALKTYRAATSKRHQILSNLGPKLRELKSTSADLDQAVERALETTSKVDDYMDRFDKLRKKDGSSPLSPDVFGRFIVALLICAVAGAGVFVNFQLIALPMSELVPSGARIASIPVSTFAALVIVLMEMTAGIFMLDALGITDLVPKIARVPTRQRRAILAIALFALLVLACVESSLAILREHIAESEVALRAALAGEASAAAGWSDLTVIGQAVLGFTLPWILALIAMPLEMLLQTMRPLAVELIALMVRAVGLALRAVAGLIQWAGRAALAVLDLYVVLPEQLMRLFKSPPQQVRTHSAEKVRT